ncbi:hypothetical protein SLNHY_3892 [Streptomyces albus]|nr:hypothetical protein SLNHY_3892 [Streptomyces albus]
MDGLRSRRMQTALPVRYPARPKVSGELSLAGGPGDPGIDGA